MARVLRRKSKTRTGTLARGIPYRRGSGKKTETGRGRIIPEITRGKKGRGHRGRKQGKTAVKDARQKTKCIPKAPGQNRGARPGKRAAITKKTKE